ncbi:MAG: glycosyltransferase family 2 protein [Patescibacteria group bacterium]
MLTDKKLSVIVACYNEAGNILAMHRRITAALEHITPNFEIIFSDNASTDDSESILRKLANDDHHVKVLFLSRNFGSSQFGYTAGTDYATGDAIVWIDGDQQDPPEMIADFVKQWLDGYEVAYGVRVKRKGNILRRAAYKLFYRIFRQLSYVPVPLDAGDFGLMDRRVADVLRSMPERDRFLRGLRAWIGFRSTGLPYVRDERHAGLSSESWRKNFSWARKAIISFSYKPLELLSNIAIIAISLSFLGILWQLYAFFILHATPQGLISSLLLIFFFGSVQLFAIAIVGEYVGKIFEEVKQRPKYVIRETLDHEKSSS